MGRKYIQRTDHGRHRLPGPSVDGSVDIISATLEYFRRQIRNNEIPCYKCRVGDDPGLIRLESSEMWLLAGNCVRHEITRNLCTSVNFALRLRVRKSRYARCSIKRQNKLRLFSRLSGSLQQRSYPTTYLNKLARSHASRRMWNHCALRTCNLLVLNF